MYSVTDQTGKTAVGLYQNLVSTKPNNNDRSKSKEDGHRIERGGYFLHERLAAEKEESFMNVPDRAERAFSPRTADSMRLPRSTQGKDGMRLSAVD